MSSSAHQLPSSEKIDVSVKIAARDEVHLHLEVQDGHITQAKLKGVGCTEFLQLISEWRHKFQGSLKDVPLPQGPSHAAILMRELIMRAQGTWDYPYKEEELCHCRAVTTAVVDGAIIGGCHTPSAVSRSTSASTSCGTCRSDVERILAYRLHGRNKP